MPTNDDRLATAGSLRDARGQALLLGLHALERDTGRGLGNTLDQPGVLVGEEALGDDQDQPQGQQRGDDNGDQRQHLVQQHPVQALHVPAVDAVEKVLAAFFATGLEQARAEHGREGQGDQRGNHDGHRHGSGELTEQPPHHVTHEQQRDHHRDQRHRQRDDGEADLRRALQCRLHAAFHPLRCSG